MEPDDRLACCQALPEALTLVPRPYLDAAQSRSGWCWLDVGLGAPLQVCPDTVGVHLGRRCREDPWGGDAGRSAARGPRRPEDDFPDYLAYARLAHHPDSAWVAGTT